MDFTFKGFKGSLKTLLSLAKSSAELIQDLKEPLYSESVLPLKRNLGESFIPFEEILREAQSKSLKISSGHPQATHPDLYRQHQENTRKFLECLLRIAVKCHAKDFEATLREDLANLS